MIPLGADPLTSHKVQSSTNVASRRVAAENAAQSDRFITIVCHIIMSTRLVRACQVESIPCMAARIVLGTSPSWPLSVTKE